MAINLNTPLITQYPIGVPKLPELPAPILGKIIDGLTVSDAIGLGKTCKEIHSLVDTRISKALISPWQHVFINPLHNRILERTNRMIQGTKDEYCCRNYYCCRVEDPNRRCCCCAVCWVCDYNSSCCQESGYCFTLSSSRISKRLFGIHAAVCYGPCDRRWTRDYITICCWPCSTVICTIPWLFALMCDLGVDIKKCCARRIFKAYILPRLQKANERDFTKLYQITDRVQEIRTTMTRA